MGLGDEKMERKEIANLTQHTASEEQKKAGVFDLNEERQEKLKQLLTFEELPTKEEIQERAEKITELAEDTGKAMIGGAPYLMASLEQALIEKGIQPLYAFSKRESVEEPLGDGSTKKTQIFRHLGFITP